jgi:hypothetical protein
VDIRRIGAQAPHQLGIGERRGGLLEAIMKKAAHNRQFAGAEALSALCRSIACEKCDHELGRFGPGPMGFRTDTHTPTDWSSLVSHDGDRQLGLHQNLVDMEEEKTPQESFMIQKRSLHAGGQLPEDSKSDAAQSCPYQGTIPSRQHGQF